ncbi:hypothetical protein ACOSP7_006757 [Xanthoceras sorbifolium]
MGSDDQKRSPGLVISNSESIRSFLVLALRYSQLSPELQEIAFNLSSLNNLPYKSIRNIWVASHPSTRADLIRLFSGSAFVFTSPKPRERLVVFFMWRLFRALKNTSVCLLRLAKIRGRFLGW